MSLAAEVRASEATTDLIASYERALDCVPLLSEKLEFMQTETAIKAEALQQKMRALVEGYEHMDSVSGAVSVGLRRAAEDYKQTVLDVAVNGGVNCVGLDTQNLDRLRAELDSMAHERVVMEVLTKDLFRDHRLGAASRARSVRNTPSQSSDIAREFIKVPEYTGSATHNANRVVERNMQSLLKPSGRAADVFVRNSSLGVLVPSARPGVSEEVRALRTTPSALPARPKTKRVRGDAVYGLLSEELSHRNASIKKELSTVKAQLHDLTNKRVPRSKAWSKDQLKGLIETVISRYASADKQPAPPEPPRRARRDEGTQADVHTADYAPPDIRSARPEDEEAEESFEAEEPLSEEALRMCGYRVLAVRGAFSGAPASVPPPSLQERPEPAPLPPRDPDSFFTDGDLGVPDCSSDGSACFMLYGDREGVHWVRTKETRPHDVGDPARIQGEYAGAQRNEEVIVISGQRLVRESVEEEGGARSVLRYRPGLVPSREQPEPPTAELQEELKVDAEVAKRTALWPVYSRVWPLRRAEESTEPLVVDTPVAADGDAVETSAEEEVPAPVGVIELATPMAPYLELLQSLVSSHHSTIQTNYEMLSSLLSREGVQSDPPPPAVSAAPQPSSSLDFYSPLTRVGVELYTGMFNSRFSNPAAESATRKLRVLDVVQALISSERFASVLVTDSRFPGDSTPQVLAASLMRKFDGNFQSFISLSEVVSFLESADVYEKVEPPPVASSTPSAAPSAGDIAQELAKAMSELVTSAVRTAVISAVPPIVTDQRPAAAWRDNQATEESDSFITYIASADDESNLDTSVLCEEGDFVGTVSGLLHSRGVGGGAHSRDVLRRDAAQSRANMQSLLEDSQVSDDVLSQQDDESSGEVRLSISLRRKISEKKPSRAGHSLASTSSNSSGSMLSSDSSQSTHLRKFAEKRSDVRNRNAKNALLPPSLIGIGKGFKTGSARAAVQLCARVQKGLDISSDDSSAVLSLSVDSRYGGDASPSSASRQKKARSLRLFHRLGKHSDGSSESSASGASFDTDSSAGDT